MTRLSPYQFVIFAGGKGTRLGSLGAECPKPVIDIDGRPLVTYLIDWAAKHGLSEIILATGHLQNILTHSLASYYDISFTEIDDVTKLARLSGDRTLILRDTGPEALTGERLYLVSDLVSASERFVLTYGDTLTDLDFSKPLAFADKMDKTICLVAGYPDARYGELIIENHFVKRFQEKAQPKFLINRGFFIIKSSIFFQWDEQIFHSFEEDAIPYFSEKQDVVAYQSDNWFFSVDSEVDAQKLTDLLRKR